VKKANKILLQFPEVKHVVCKVGAGEIPTDPTPLETGDYIITLKDKKEWTTAKTREELIGKMEEALSPIAGVQFEFQQPIQMRQNELISGSKQDIAVKIFGDDLNTLTDKANEVKRVIQDIPGIEDMNIEKVTGLEQVQVTYDRQRLAQYGLSVSDVSQVLRTAFAGSQAGIVYDGEKRFGLVVRLAKDYRSDLQDIRNLTIPLPRGGQLPIEQVASVEIKEGPAQISREETRRRITIGFNVRNSDVESVIKEVQNRIDTKVKMPTGYYVSYGGQFQNLQEAKQRLAVAVPVALLLIFILLYFAFRSVKEALLIYTAVPMSVIGGILALWIRGMNFSISAGIGFIALFGIAVLNGIVLISEFNHLEKSGMTDIKERVLTALRTRLRPVIITASAASLGFFPMAISTSAGAEVQKPLATVVIGGLISATLLTLVVLPIFYIYFSNFSFRKMFKSRSSKVLTMVLIAVSVGTIQTHAQHSIKLHDAIQMALDSNLAVRSQQYNVRINETLKGAAFDLPKTELNGEYGRINSYTNDNSFGVSQSFAFPTVYANRYKLAKAGVKDSQWSLEGARLDIATQVKRLYWQYVYLQTKKQLISYQDSLYADLQKTAEIRHKTGESRQLEAMSARSQRMEARNRLVQMESDIQICTQRLQTALNAAYSFVPADTHLPLLSFSANGNASISDNNPLAAQARQRIETSQLEQKLEKSMMLPDFNIGVSSMTIKGTQEVNGTARYFGNGFRFNSVQVGVAIPLFYSSFKSKVKAAKLKEQMAIAQHADITKNLSSEYNTLLAQYGRQQGNISYYEKQAVPEAELIIKQSARSYKEGEISYAEYMMNVSRALDIKQNYIDTLNDCNQTVISLESITGKIF
jgi:cobalt-zinc-cadmium resistance protein CzcA